MSKKKKPTDIGMNLTGSDSAPFLNEEMADNSQLKQSTSSTNLALSLRKDYFRHSEIVGSVPLPTTAKALVSTAVKRIAGRKPEVFLDKLGERIAFERTGTRLYSLALEKITAFPQSLPTEFVQLLERYRDEERMHLRLAKRVMREIGGDPTAVTPCADVSGVASLGWVQLACDPRVTALQTVQVLLMAELVDGEGWGLLVELANELGFTEAASDFGLALQQEVEHLAGIRHWYGRLSLQEMGAGTGEHAA